MGHELAIAEAVLRVALAEARKHGAGRIRTLRLEVGDLEAVEPRLLQDAFDLVARGTSAAGARIAVDTVPASVVCEDCGRKASQEIHAHGVDGSSRCPDCGGGWRVVQGMGWQLLSVKVQT